MLLLIGEFLADRIPHPVKEGGDEYDHLLIDVFIVVKGVQTYLTTCRSKSNMPVVDGYLLSTICRRAGQSRQRDDATDYRQTEPHVRIRGPQIILLSS